MDKGQQGSTGERLLRRLGVERSEVGILFYGALCLAAVGWTDVSLANISETYFLKRVGVQYLPLAFLASSVLLVGTGFLLSRYVANRDRSFLLPVIFAALAGSLMLIWALFQLEIPGATESLILISKQFKMAAMLVFWVVLGDSLNARQSKRLYAPLTAGATLGAIGGSFASGAIGQYIGLNMVLPFTSGILVLGGLIAIPLGRQNKSNLEKGLAPKAVMPKPEEEASAKAGESVAEMWRNHRLFRLMAVMVVLGSLVAPMLYYQFQYVADMSTSGANAEEQLLNLYSQVRGWLNILILVAQLTIASSLYRRLGVPRSAGMTPFLFLAAFLGLAVSLSLSIGIAAMVATRLYNQSVYQPALKVLFNLFPESLRARATAFLDGPLDRLGGAAGNMLVLGTIQVTTASAISYVAIPAVVGWAISAALLWRAYPTLLLGAASTRRLGDDTGEDPATLLDRTTLRSLLGELRGSNPHRCRAAISLLADAQPEDAIATLVEAIDGADVSTRPLLGAALVSLVEEHGKDSLDLPRLAGALIGHMENMPHLPLEERANLLWAATHMTASLTGETGLERACAAAREDAEPGIRLIGFAGLTERGRNEDEARTLDHMISDALASENELARHIAQRELVHLLLTQSPNDTWERRMHLIEALLSEPECRNMAAEALAEVASQHGESARLVADSLKPYEDDPDPHLRASALRFAGHSGQADRAPMLVEALGSNDPLVAAAAHDGLLALGPGVAKDLLIGHSFGRISNRAAILSVLRRMEIQDDTLRGIYETELGKIGAILLRLHALSERAPAVNTDSSDSPESPVNPIVLQRLEERMDEGIRAALLFLSVLKDNNQIAELEPALRRYKGQRQRAIILEALESMLTPHERDRILPLVDETSLDRRVRAVASASPDIELLDFQVALHGLLDDPDELTRTLSIATWPRGFDTRGELERSSYDQEYTDMSSPVEIALLLKSVPLFEHLSTRHLINLAHATKEESFPANTVLCREGDVGNCMYVIVEGEAVVTIGDTKLADIHTQGFFGEMALFDGVSRSATVTSSTKVRLLRLDRDDLMALMEELPSIAIGLCRVLSRKLRDTNELA